MRVTLYPMWHAVAVLLLAALATARAAAPSASSALIAPSDSGHCVVPATLDLHRLLPPFPPVGSVEARAELDELLKLQSERTPAQVARARADAEVSVFRFADALGNPPQFTAAQVPLTAALFRKLSTDESGVMNAAKDEFARPRPFKVEPRLEPAVSRPGSASYPSGHATWAYTVALVLADMVPERREQIVARADEYARNRNVGGVHYPSDVAAGHLAATAIAAMLFVCAPFQHDEAAAAAELRQALGLAPNAPRPAQDVPAKLRADAPTVLITGANRGIGFELARQYAEAGWNVIATSRRAADDPGLDDLRAVQARHPQLVIERIDVTDSGMIRTIAARYRDQPIDVLVNNAAAVEDTFAADLRNAAIPYDQLDYDAAGRDFDVNTLGPMRMVQAFGPNVERSRQKKVVTITSLAGSLTHGLPGATAMNYSASKAALNKYMVMLAFAMKPKGVTVGLFEPILVASKKDMANVRGAAPVDQEVAKLIKLIDAMTPEDGGKIRNFSTGAIDPF